MEGSQWNDSLGSYIEERRGDADEVVGRENTLVAGRNA